VKAFVITRDRLTYTRRCVEALLDAGFGGDVVLVDHGSTYPPMLDWRDAGGLPFGVEVWADDNRHPRDLWRTGGPIEQCVEPGERYIVTDCDVVPADDCPGDWVAYLGQLLDHNPHAVKAGLGLRTSDLPEHFTHAATVQAWEAKYQPPLAAPVGVWSAVWSDIDTTLAMYRGSGPFRLGPAIRTMAPYEALHLPWYEDTVNPSEEAAFYAAQAVHGHWRKPDGFADDHGLEG
jgi:hypothetical protein